MTAEIIVVGSCNIDLTNYVSRMPLPGETISGESFKVSFGGKGANQAVMAKLLGATVAMVGKVGKDVFGKTYIDHLKSIGVEVVDMGESCDDVSTGTATIIVNKEGQNCIIVTPGANKQVDKEYVRQTLLHLLPTAKVLMVQMEIDREATLEALKLAKKHKVVTLFNVAPAYTDLSREFYENTDIICVNETELQTISGLSVDFTDKKSLKAASEKLVSYGCAHVIVTLGELGAILFNKKYPDGQQIPLVNKVQDVVDTTGSGDAFVGTICYFIAKKLSQNHCDGEYLTPEIISKGVIVASSTVTTKGAQSSYLEGIKKIDPSQLNLS